MGLGGGVLCVLCCFSVGGCGGANLGCSGTLSSGGLHMDDAEPEEQLDGGLGGAIGGGFNMDKSSSSIDAVAEVSLGAGMEGG